MSRPTDMGAPELWRWQGRTDASIDEHTRRLDVINGDVRASRMATEKILVEVAVLRTKIAIWASLGGMVGAGIVSALVAVFTG